MLSNRGVSGKLQSIRPMRTVLIQGQTGRQLGIDALLEAGEGKALSGRIKAIRTSGDMTVRNIRPTIFNG
jgi:hypothetical protein